MARRICRRRCPRQESNLDLPLRRRSSYPLDYEGATPSRSLSEKATGALAAGGGWGPPRRARGVVLTAVGRGAPRGARVEAEAHLVPIERRPLQSFSAPLAHTRGDRGQ